MIANLLYQTETALPSPEYLDDVVGLVVQLLVAIALGIVIAKVHAISRRDHPVAATFAPTLVLLTVLIAMVTQVIGDNLARAFGLVGALSIVRFRTVVEDTQDIAFVIFAVVIGMAVGANYWMISVVGTLVVSGAALVIRPGLIQNTTLGSKNEPALLEIRLAMPQDRTTLQPLFDEYLSKHTLVAAESSRGGAAYDLRYRVQIANNKSPIDLVQAIHRVDGVLSAGFKQDNT